MPILIALKNPRMNLIAEGEINDIDEKKWDEIFNNQVLLVKNEKGRNTLIPLLQECNIAVMEDTTDEEIKKMEKMAEERKKLMEAQGKGGKGSMISPAGFAFPAGRSGRG